jgi:hypothetical protein
MKSSIKLTVFFEEPFWIGIFARTQNEKYEVARVVFGSEPKDYEVYEFVLKAFYHVKYTCSIAVEKQKEKKINPKRMQRKIKKAVQDNGIGTKAQQAMKLQYEDNKIQKRKKSKEMKEEEKRKRFSMKQQKKKEKHKGH